MAIFKCPECGNTVSTTAACCPNCGMKFTVCPECGKIYKGQPSVCPNCGAALNKASHTSNAASHAAAGHTSPQKDNGVYTDSNVTLFKIWGQASAKNCILNFISDRKEIILYATLAFFACIGLIIYFVWNGTADTVRKCETLTNTFSSIKTVIVIATIVVIVIAAIILFARIYRDKTFISWLATKKYDYARYLSKYMEAAKKTPHEYAIAGHLDEVYCFYLTKYPTAAKTRIIAYVSGFLGFITFIIGYAIVGTPYLGQFQAALSSQLLLGEDVAIHYEIVPIIIPAIIGIVLGFAEMGIGETLTTKKAEQWMKEQMEARGIAPKE